MNTTHIIEGYALIAVVPILISTLLLLGNDIELKKYGIFCVASLLWPFTLAAVFINYFIEYVYWIIEMIHR